MMDDRIAAAFEPQMAPRDDVTGDVAEVDLTTDDDDDPEAIDRGIVRTAGELRTRDLAIGRLVRFVFETGLWRALGYASFDHFVRERLGMSRASVRSKMALVRDDDRPRRGRRADRADDGRARRRAAVLRGGAE